MESKAESELEPKPDQPTIKVEPVEMAESYDDSKPAPDGKVSKKALMNGEVIPGFSALDFFLSRLRKETKSTAASKAAKRLVRRTRTVTPVTRCW